MKKIKLICGWLMLSVWLIMATAVAAQSPYPPYEDIYVNDYADVISPADETAMRQLLASYNQETGVEMTVLTVSSIHDYNTGDDTIEQFATHLFNTWGIGNPDLNDGVLLLVAVADHELRIELGTGYGSEYDGRMQRIIDRTIIPYFRQNNYSLGIHEGSRAIIADLTGQVYESLAESRGIQPTAVPTRRPVSTPPPFAPSSRGFSLNDVPITLLLMFLIVAGGLGFILVQQYRRYGPRKCPHCQTALIRLDEKADDAFLNKGQLAEERLGSVDYDVWTCPECEHNEIFSYGSWIPRYGRCQKCDFRTVRSTSFVVESPTYTSSGLRRHRSTCAHCGHEREWDTPIPRLEERSSSHESNSHVSSHSSSSHSSSSSSSFSGGSSSGHGASGKW